MGYIFLMNSYCFEYEQFCQIIKNNIRRQSILTTWLEPLIDDNIILSWLISLKDPKTKPIIDIITKCQSCHKPTEAIIKEICLELELA